MSETEYQKLVLKTNNNIHKSEQDLKIFDHIIYNDGTIEDLDKKIISILKCYPNYYK